MTPERKTERTQSKRPDLIKSTFVEPDTSGRRALDVLNKLESPISAGLAEGVRRITGRNKTDHSKRNGCFCKTQ